MGHVGSAAANALMESLLRNAAARAARPPELDDRAELASAIFEWIEGWYHPRRRHTSIGDLSPVDYPPVHRRRRSGMIITRDLSGEPGQAPFGELVEMRGLEPLTSALRTRRSPN